MSEKYNTYNREKLYREVWKNPVTKVAEQYGVSDVAIHKICKNLNVPTPPLGYWAKIRAGAKIEKTPLPKAKGIKEIIGIKTYEGKKPMRIEHELSFLTDEEKVKIFKVAQNITPTDENKKITSENSSI